MGDLLCKLCSVFCCPPFISSVVNKLAFSPPTKSYSKNIHEDGTISIVANIDIEHIQYIEYHEVSIEKEVIAIVFIRTAPNSKYTILHSHGNAVDLGHICGILVELGLKLGVNVVSYDYSGYGESSGSPSESKLLSNVQAVVEFMHQDLSINYNDIVVYGQSIGSIPTVYIAGKFQFAAVILHSPIASGFKLFESDCLNHCFCCLDVLDNYSRASKILSPTLLIHGTDDEVVPVEHTFFLVQRIPSHLLLEPLIIYGATHNDCDAFYTFNERLTQFFLIDLPHLRHKYDENTVSFHE